MFICSQSMKLGPFRTHGEWGQRLSRAVCSTYRHLIYIDTTACASKKVSEGASGLEVLNDCTEAKGFYNCELLMISWSHSRSLESRNVLKDGDW